MTVRNDSAHSPEEHGGAVARTELAASRLLAEDRSALGWDAAASGSRAERPGARPCSKHSGLLAAFPPT